MSTTYVRRFTRDPYEGILVQALVECGYFVRLSTDEEDERGGFDIVDNEFLLRIDAYIGNCANGRYAEKLAKAASRGVQVLSIPATLIDDLCLPSCRSQALKKLEELYFNFLDKLSAFRRHTQSAVA